MQPKAKAKGEPKPHLEPRVGRRQGIWAFVALLALACSDDGVSYERDVKPLFEARCVACHFSGNTSNLVDIQDPFTPEDGLVGSVNEWWASLEAHRPYTPQYNVVPFEPDPSVSFLMRKITETELLPGGCDDNEEGERCLQDDNGTFMPPQGRLDPAQVATIREWIDLGAPNLEGTGPDYPPGTYSCPDQAEHSTARLECVSRIISGSCNYCHYENSPDPPDFSKMFDPVEGLVGTPSAYRSDINIVEPGEPNASFLVMKIEGRGPSEVGSDDPYDPDAPHAPSSEIGAPMPREFELFSPAEVAVIRQWIAEGARND